nr:SEC59/DGK1/VTE5 family protein [Candidatus Gracilibacteria bacterium]
ERPEHWQNWPGQGLFFFVLGSWSVLSLFPRRIAIAAIAVLLVGDAFTNIVGRLWGKIPNPLNRRKTVEGTLAGIVSAFVVLNLFFVWPSALVAAIIGMIVEIPTWKIGKFPVDDNLTIPLSVGLILYILAGSIRFLNPYLENYFWTWFY